MVRGLHGEEMKWWEDYMIRDYIMRRLYGEGITIHDERTIR